MTSRPYAEVIGDPIAHSKSPRIHNFWLEKLGIEADYRSTRVTRDKLGDYLAERRGDPAWRGSNVTMPLKIDILAHVARLSEDAEQVRAANVVMPIEEGALGGFNSDVDGVAEPLRAIAARHGPIAPRTLVRIIGAGGAAPAAAIGAIRAGHGRFEVFARDPAKAEVFAEMVAAASGVACPHDDLGALREPPAEGASVILINATPMGMAGQPEVPIDLADYGADTILFDMVYDPLETGLVRQARARGLLVIDGLQMLVGQAAMAFEHFFAAPAPREHDAELRALLTA